MAPASQGLSAVDSPVPWCLQLPQPPLVAETSPRLVRPTAVSLPNEAAGEQQLAWEQQLVRGQQELAALQRMCSTVDRWAACHIQVPLSTGHASVTLSHCIMTCLCPMLPKECTGM